jgi:hypothetical protein
MHLAVVDLALGGEAKSRLRLGGPKKSLRRVTTNFRPVLETVA